MFFSIALIFSPYVFFVFSVVLKIYLSFSFSIFSGFPFTSRSIFLRFSWSTKIVFLVLFQCFLLFLNLYYSSIFRVSLFYCCSNIGSIVFLVFVASWFLALLQRRSLLWSLKNSWQNNCYVEHQSRGHGELLLSM